MITLSYKDAKYILPSKHFYSLKRKSKFKLREKLNAFNSLGIWTSYVYIHLKSVIMASIDPCLERL